jgi:hypothetical protein
LFKADLNDLKALFKKYTVAKLEKLTPKQRVKIINQEIFKEKAKLKVYKQK